MAISRGNIPKEVTVGGRKRKKAVRRAKPVKKR
jgi:hypothetical protein